MKVEFKINDLYLVGHAIHGTDYERFSSPVEDPKRKDLLAFLDKARDISKRGTRFLSNGSDVLLNATIEDIIQGCDEVVHLFKTLPTTDEYRIIHQQTKDYVSFLQTEWEQKGQETKKFVEEITGYDFSNDSFMVIVTHPSLRNGRHRGKGLVSWGHHPVFNNYDIVYLWHEFLHDRITGEPIPHAVVDFIADNELRCRLNGDSYPPIVGHSRLMPLKNAMLEDWKGYLSSGERNIDAFIARMKDKYKDFIQRR